MTDELALSYWTHYHNIQDCHEKLAVCKVATKIAYGPATHVEWTGVFGSLSTKQRWFVFPHCYGRWDVGILLHPRNQATFNPVGAIQLHQTLMMCMTLQPPGISSSYTLQTKACWTTLRKRWASQNRLYELVQFSAEHFYAEKLMKLVWRHEKCLEVNGNYVEKWNTFIGIKTVNKIFFCRIPFFNDNNTIIIVFSSI